MPAQLSWLASLVYLFLLDTGTSSVGTWPVSVEKPKTNHYQIFGLAIYSIVSLLFGLIHYLLAILIFREFENLSKDRQVTEAYVLNNISVGLKNLFGEVRLVFFHWSLAFRLINRAILFLMSNCCCLKLPVLHWKETYFLESIACQRSFISVVRNCFLQAIIAQIRPPRYKVITCRKLLQRVRSSNNHWN